MLSSPPAARSSELVLVTGVSGFLGSWCAVTLLRAGYRVRGSLRRMDQCDRLRQAIQAEGVTADSDRLTFCKADLTKDDGWAEAVKGCAYVLHVASDMGGANSTLQQLLPASRDGTVRVVQASIAAGVRRIVLTSSVETLMPMSPVPGVVLDESGWANADDAGRGAYSKSKIMAEQAAWELINKQSAPTAATTSLSTPTSMVSILPVFIGGPIVGDQIPPSVQIVSRLLQGAVPAVPNIGWSTVDVRDCAELHLLAMRAHQAEGQRYIAASKEFIWFSEIAALLHRKMGAHAAQVTQRVAPDWIVRFFGFFGGEAGYVARRLRRKVLFSAAKAESQLQWTARGAEAMIVDCANSLIKAGVV